MIGSMKPRLLAGAATLLIAVGALGAVAAVRAQTPSQPAVTQQAEDADNVQEPQLNGSIQVAQDQANAQSEADEAAALAPLATITSDQAVAAAQAQVPGQVQQVELDNENGSLVYSVEIDGKDVKVDAGTGTVLHVEQPGAED